jgi:hypothetical protein
MNPISRARRCRQIARENASFARDCQDPSVRQGYVELVRRWLEMAEDYDIERSDDPTQPKTDRAVDARSGGLN